MAKRPSKWRDEDLCVWLVSKGFLRVRNGIALQQGVRRTQARTRLYILFTLRVCILPFPRSTGARRDAWALLNQFQHTGPHTANTQDFKTDTQHTEYLRVSLVFKHFSCVRRVLCVAQTARNPTPPHTRTRARSTEIIFLRSSHADFRAQRPARIGRPALRGGRRATSSRANSPRSNLPHPVIALLTRSARSVHCWSTPRHLRGLVRRAAPPRRPARSPRSRRQRSRHRISIYTRTHFL